MVGNLLAYHRDDQTGVKSPTTSIARELLRTSTTGQPILDGAGCLFLTKFKENHSKAKKYQLLRLVPMSI
jgi:hypothetical protein